MPDFPPRQFFVIAICAALAACGSESGSGPKATTCPAPARRMNDVTRIDAQVDPHGTAPLVAIATVETQAPATLVWRLEGRDGQPSDVSRTITACSTVHELEILGLYPGHANQITVTVMNDGRPTGNRSFLVQTAALPSGLPAFHVDRQYSNSQPAFFLFDARNSGFPVIVDRYGNIRWLLLANGTKYGLQILRNGNIGYGHAEDSSVVEYTMLGRFVKQWSVLPDFYNVHHDVFEMNNGNFLVTADKVGLDTIEDFIIELDRATSAIVRTWDLRQILPKRSTLVQDSRDWFHINAVIHDARDDSIIVSGQRQGIVKITADNHLRWILAPPDGWTGYEQFLLTAIPSQDFDWPWGQHAPLLLPDGDLMLFDNGFARDYGAAAEYSRIVQYHLTENAAGGGTVQQVWQYGKERGETLYSPIVSDVDHLPASGTFLMTSGSLFYELDYVSPSSFSFSRDLQPDYARILEIDAGGNVLFEMAVLSDVPGVLMYRAEKVDLYQRR
jgi:arylsulfate sulfotransferase